MIFKWGDRRHLCQSYYKPYKQFGTGVPEYDDLSECSAARLQAQADQLAEERGDLDRKRRQLHPFEAQ